MRASTWSGVVIDGGIPALAWAVAWPMPVKNVAATIVVDRAIEIWRCVMLWSWYCVFAVQGRFRERLRRTMDSRRASFT